MIKHEAYWLQIGCTLKEARELLGVTVAGAANQFGPSEYKWTRYEAGKEKTPYQLTLSIHEALKTAGLDVNSMPARWTPSTVQQLIDLHHLSLNHLAKLCGVTQPAVKLWTQGTSPSYLSCLRLDRAEKILQKEKRKKSKIIS